MPAAAAAAASCRKTRRQTWLPSCFFHPCVYDPNDSPAEPASRPRRQNKALPLTEEISEDGEGLVAEGGGMKREISPAANCQKGMPEKNRKIEKRCKLSSVCMNKRCNNHHPFINYQPAATIDMVNRRGPVQPRTRMKTMHSGWSGTARLIDRTQSYPKLDLLAGLKMITMMLVTILIGGKIFAVFITTICFYVLSCVGLSRSPMLIVPARKNPRRYIL